MCMFHLSDLLSTTRYLNRPLATRLEAPIRKPSIDEATRQMLDRKLGERPDKSELVQRNILKGPLGNHIYEQAIHAKHHR